MEEWMEYMLNFTSLNRQQVEELISKGCELNLKKDHYSSEAGKIPKQIGFVVEGVLRGCYYNYKGEEITRCFVSEHSLLCDYFNFEAGTSSSEYIQAITDCKLIVFSKQSWDALSHTIIGWDNIKNKMLQLCMYQKSRKGPVISQDATTWYLQFMENYLAMINRIPLIYVASYLGITQQSLSRIRKQIN